ncbi:hypothetical protein H8D76_02555 [Candidatus Bathyarchaeota archaeon]|nr:hypothetical protein [Candidatus Bathyarchaeota archaeon]
MNHDNRERLIAEASKIRDINMRHKYLKTQRINDEDINGILDDVHYRTRGRDKFPRASKMRFTRDGLAMATGKAVAEYRTWKIRKQLGRVRKALDACTGIGGDTIAMALRWPVVSVEIDPEIIEILRHNIEVYDVQDRVEIVQGDITKLVNDEGFKSKLDEVDVIFFDPSRRGDGGRTVKTEEYVPPLSFIDELLTLCPNLCVKISPGTDLDRIRYDCDIEVISNRGEAKEVVLWFGKLKLDQEAKTVLATKLPEKMTMERDTHVRNEITQVKNYLFEPDPAYIKARLIDTLAQCFELTQIHPKIAYLTGDERLRIPVLKTYEVMKVTSLDPDEINAALRELGIGRVDFKARGVRVDMKGIHKRIHGEGRRRGLVVFTVVGKNDAAIICSYA